MIVENIFELIVGSFKIVCEVKSNDISVNDYCGCLCLLYLTLEKLYQGIFDTNF